MTPYRLLVPALLLCPALLFAQGNPHKTLPMENHPLLASSSDSPFSALRIDPLGSRQAEVPQDPLARLQASVPPQFKTNQDNSSKTLLLPDTDMGPGFVIYPEQVAGGGTCFAIRSYVVARDSKSSDSVHPVSSSTCVSAHKVQLKNATGSAHPLQLEK